MVQDGARDLAVPPPPGLRLVALEGEERERALGILKESFVGIYRWHAKRTLHHADRVHALLLGEEVVAAALLHRLAPEVGYVYYIFVGKDHRRKGFAGFLLDDALAFFRTEGAQVIYAAAEGDNFSSIALFRSRGFREVAREEPGFREGGLGAWGLRSKMTLVSGEVLLGRRL